MTNNYAEWTALASIRPRPLRRGDLLALIELGNEQYASIRPRPLRRGDTPTRWQDAIRRTWLQFGRALSGAETWLRSWAC